MYSIHVSIDSSNQFVASPSLKIDHVHLKVSNLHEAVEFYQSILGFTVLDIDSERDLAYLGLAESTSEKSSALLVLDQVDAGNNTYSLNKRRAEAGLFHFAILLPERKYLGSFLRHIQNNLDSQFYQGTADHEVSESVYIHDPDHNGIEVYRDRNPSEWEWAGEHKVHMVTEPLDVSNLLNQYGSEMWGGFPTNTTIGHVHLHVSNLAKAKKFYHQLLGLYHTASYPGAYFFAADNYHHHIATNTWLGTNILHNSSNDHSKLGLDHYAVKINGNKEDHIKLLNRLRTNEIAINEDIDDSDIKHESLFYIYDPDGIKIQLLFC